MRLWDNICKIQSCKKLIIYKRSTIQVIPFGIAIIVGDEEDDISLLYMVNNTLSDINSSGQLDQKLPITTFGPMDQKFT